MFCTNCGTKDFYYGAFGPNCINPACTHYKGSKLGQTLATQKTNSSRTIVSQIIYKNNPPSYCLYCNNPSPNSDAYGPLGEIDYIEDCCKKFASMVLMLKFVISTKSYIYDLTRPLSFAYKFSAVINGGTTTEYVQLDYSLKDSPYHIDKIVLLNYTEEELENILK